MIRAALVALVLSALSLCWRPAEAQTPGTLNLVGPSTSPGAPQLTPAAINTGVNAQLSTKLDATNGVATGLTLSADPTLAAQAATKQYVDTHGGGDLSATAFGTCTWDASHDVAPCIQAALTYAATLPTGATVHLPRGQFQLASALTIGKSAISLVTDGRGGILRHDAPPNVMSYATHLVWTGAGGATMLTVAPPDNAVSGQRMGGNNLVGIMFDCAGIAATCVKFASSVDSHVDVAFAEPNGGQGLLIDTAVLAEANDAQQNAIEVSGIVLNTATPGVVLDGSAASGTGNISIMRMPSVRVIHKDGDCMQVRRADHVMTGMLNCSRRPAGTGNTLVLYGNNTLGGAYSNWFGYVGGAGNIVAKGTSSYTNPSQNNVIDWLDKTNNTPDPTIETGASLYWRRDDGINVGFGSYRTDFAPSAATMTLLRAQTQVDPVRILSNANTGIALMATTGPTPLIGRFYIDPSDGIMHFQNVGNLAGIQFGATMPMASLTNIAVGGANQANAGKGVLEIHEATNLPTANPGDGLLIYSNAGVMTVRDSTGNIYPLTTAPHTPRPLLADGALGACVCGSTTVEDVMKTITLSAGQLAAVGDRILIHAAGTFAASTDTKTVRLRVTNISGTLLGFWTGTTSAQTTWAVDIKILKTGTNTQTMSILGGTLNLFNGVTTSTRALTDSSSIVLVLTSLNGTATTAGSIAVQLLTIDYWPAP